MDRLIGTRAGNYELASWIGGGGMGDVYRAEHVSMGARVAIKVLRATAEADPHATERLLREAKAVNRISHDGVIKIVDGGRLATGQPYLVMELLEGESLAQRLHRMRHLPIPEACGIVVEALDAIAAAHACDVVHRDLKPANIFVTQRGRVVVLDFGIARLIETNSPARLTLTGVALGTPAYMAPEQIRGETIGPQADVYAMGVTLYELICGARPFNDAATREMMISHLEQSVVLPATIPAPVRDVLSVALAKDPDRRYPNGAVMRDALRIAIGSLSMTPPVARAPTKRGSLVGPAIAVVVLGAVAFGIGLVVSGDRPHAAIVAGSDAAAATGSATDPQVIEAPHGAVGCVPVAGVVCTDRGPVRGKVVGDVTSYLDIPFAKPPIGPLRWRPPQAAEPWSIVRGDAPAACVQSRDLALFGSEDCLYLDVYAPTAAGPHPVVFFIHGGNNISGSRRDIDGSELAKRANVVVVIASYRLGVFGWLAHPSLATPKETAGNYGMLDQLAALRWVHTNVERFGGDPARVVLAGQSAGAIDACNLIASPAAAGLFSRAWLMSGSCYAMPVETAHMVAELAVGMLDCTTAATAATCLRGKTAAELLEVPGAATSSLIAGASFYPVIDGTTIAAQPMTVMRAGTYNHVPTVIGTTGDEMLAMLGLFVPAQVNDDPDFRRMIETLYTTGAGAVLESYPSKAYPSPRHALAAVLADQFAHCPARRTARALVEHQQEPVWRYLFQYHFTEPRLADLGAMHGIDLLFLANDFRMTGGQPSPAEAAIRDAFIAAFARFAASGDLPASWPRYTVARDSYAAINTKLAVGSNFHSAVCDKWDYAAP